MDDNDLLTDDDLNEFAWVKVHLDDPPFAALLEAAWEPLDLDATGDPPERDEAVEASLAAALHADAFLRIAERVGALTASAPPTPEELRKWPVRPKVAPGTRQRALVAGAQSRERVEAERDRVRALIRRASLFTVNFERQVVLDRKGRVVPNGFEHYIRFERSRRPRPPVTAAAVGPMDPVVSAIDSFASAMTSALVALRDAVSVKPIEDGTAVEEPSKRDPTLRRISPIPGRDDVEAVLADERVRYGRALNDRDIYMWVEGEGMSEALTDEAIRRQLDEEKKYGEDDYSLLGEAE